MIYKENSKDKRKAYTDQTKIYIKTTADTLEKIINNMLKDGYSLQDAYYIINVALHDICLNEELGLNKEAD